MLDYCDFRVQTSERDDDGRLLRPDMVVKLPGGKMVSLPERLRTHAPANHHDVPEHIERQLTMLTQVTEQVQAANKHARKLAPAFGCAMARVKFCAMLGLLAALYHYAQAIWWYQPVGWVTVGAIYDWLEFAIAGLVLAKFLTPKPIPAFFWFLRS